MTRLTLIPHRIRELFNRSCCQILITAQPEALRVLFTFASRRRFRSSLARQNSAFEIGKLPCFGHACQKQPSTKMANRILGNTKSGAPNIFDRLRQPLILSSRNNLINASSVDTFPRLFTLAIMEDLFVVVIIVGAISLCHAFDS